MVNSSIEKNSEVFCENSDDKKKVPRPGTERIKGVPARPTRVPRPKKKPEKG